MLAPIEYAPLDTVVVVQANGAVRFKGCMWRVSKALCGLPIAIRPDAACDGRFDLYFAHHHLDVIDMHLTE